MNLQQKIDFLRTTPFPMSSKDDELSDWICELHEVDTYCAGLAISFLDGCDISIHSPDCTQVLKQRLASLGGDAMTMNICLKRIEILDEILQDLKSFTQSK